MTVVYLIDDDEAVLDALNMYLEAKGFEVQAFTSAQRAWPVLVSAAGGGCIVCDVRLPGMTGTELQKRLNEIQSQVPIIFISGHADVEIAVAAVKAGAFDFLVKPFREERLAALIHDAVAQAQPREVEQQRLMERLSDLSVRQRQVMQLAAEGRTNKEIGLKLGISPRTVEIIGLKKSVFRNATGLFHPEHQMTARELAMLARHLITAYPEQYALFAMKEYTYGKTKFTNRNPLLGLVPGVDGLKTGFIKEAGYGLVASAVQEGRRLIIVVNGLATQEERKEEGRRLLEWGYKNFTPARLFDANEVVGYARVWGGNRYSVPLVGQGDIDMLLPRAPANPKLSARITYTGPLKPPLKRGDQVAMLRVTSPQDATTEVPLYVAEDVGEGKLWWRGLDSLLHLATRWMR